MKAKGIISKAQFTSSKIEWGKRKVVVRCQPK